MFTTMERGADSFREHACWLLQERNIRARRYAAYGQHKTEKRDDSRFSGRAKKTRQLEEKRRNEVFWQRINEVHERIKTEN